MWNAISLVQDVYHSLRGYNNLVLSLNLLDTNNISAVIYGQLILKALDSAKSRNLNSNYSGQYLDWFIDFNGINPSGVILYLKIRESRTLYIYIYIFRVVVSEFLFVLSNMR